MRSLALVIERPYSYRFIEESGADPGLARVTVDHSVGSRLVQACNTNTNGVSCCVHQKKSCCMLS